MKTLQFVDSHIHLTDFGRGVDIGVLLSQSAEAGVRFMLCNGTSETDWESVLSLAKRYPQVIPCFGLHPWFVEARSLRWLEVLGAMLEANPEAGLGEAGLDKCVDEYDEKAQEEVLRAQLGLARRYKRPVMLHCVRTWGKMLEILRSEPLPEGMLLHAYGGSSDLIKPLSDMGAYFSFSATVLRDHHKRSRETVKLVPSDRLLIETDAPNMLPPEGFRPFTAVSPDGHEMNHPANLPVIANGIAELRRVDVDTLAEQVWNNTQRFLSSLLLKADC